MRHGLIAFLFIMIFSVAGLSQTTWYVDDSNTTGPWVGNPIFPFKCIGIDPGTSINGGIEIAASGDTIIVMPGTYHETLDFAGKNLVVKSDSGAAVTFIDGGSLDSVVKFQTGETSDAVLEGFTVMNGLANYGAGVYCSKTSPVIRANIFKDNVANYSGGGIYLNKAPATIDGNKFESNLANGGSSYGGAGICSYYSQVQILNNEFTNNVSNNVGGGIYSTYYSNYTVSGNTFTSNTGSSGGAIFAGDHSTVLISGNTMKENYAYNSGGGIYCSSSTTPTIVGNTILDNTADGGSKSGGGGIYWNYGHGSSHLTNNILCGNHAPNGYGGGIFCDYYFSCPIMNNTICDNDANYGGGIFFRDNSSATVTNTIVWNNTANTSEPQIYVSSSCSPTVNFSDIEGGWFGTGSDNLSGDSVLDAPLLDSEYHLTKFSPGINRGTAIDAPADDIDGDARPYMGVVDVDMGADEYVGPHSFKADVFIIDGAAGGEVNFEIDAGVGYDHCKYMIFAGLSGTNPGITLPQAKKILPLNWDAFTTAFINIAHLVPGFLGYLDGTGRQTAQLPPVPGALVGFDVLTFAVSSMNPFDLVTNPINIDIQ